MENTILLFIGGMRGWQFVIVVVLAIILFGRAGKIPQIMRNLGKGVHSFRQGLEDAKEEMSKPIQKSTSSEESTTAKDVDADKE